MLLIALIIYGGVIVVGYFMYRAYTSPYPSPTLQSVQTVLFIIVLLNAIYFTFVTAPLL